MPRHRDQDAREWTDRSRMSRRSVLARSAAPRGPSTLEGQRPPLSALLSHSSCGWSPLGATRSEVHDKAHAGNGSGTFNVGAGVQRSQEGDRAAQRRGPQGGAQASQCPRARTDPQPPARRRLDRGWLKDEAPEPMVDSGTSAEGERIPAPRGGYNDYRQDPGRALAQILKCPTNSGCWT